MPFRRQVGLDLVHRGLAVPNAYRLDMVVGEALVVKIKAVEAILPVHRAQLLTYMRLSGYRLGLLLNFNVVMLRHGIVRMVL